MTATLQAYKGKQSVKDKYIERARKHREADQVVQGMYWDGQEGCCVGCLAHTDDNPHAKLAKDCCVDERLYHLADAIHEGLPEGEFESWPERFMAAIPVGADLSKVWYQFSAWLLSDSKLLTITDANREAIATVAKLHKRAAKGDMPTADEWSAAADAAYAASAAYAAYAAARAAAWQKMAAKLLALMAATTPKGT